MIGAPRGAIALAFLLAAPAAARAEDPPPQEDELDCARDVAACASRCELGMVEACRAAGELYLGGAGGARDPGRARELFARGCRGDDPIACFMGATMARRGVGGPVESTQAVVDYARACALGHAPACSQAAAMFRNGEGVAHDPSAAAELERRGCDLADWLCAPVAQGVSGSSQPEPAADPEPIPTSIASPDPGERPRSVAPVRYRDRYFLLRFRGAALLEQVRPVSTRVPTAAAGGMGFRAEATFEGLSSFRPGGAFELAMRLTEDMEQILDVRLDLGVARAFGPIDLFLFVGGGADAVGASAEPRSDRYRRAAHFLVELGGRARARLGRAEISALAAWGVRGDDSAEVRLELAGGTWVGGRLVEGSFRALDYDDALIVGGAISITWESR